MSHISNKKKKFIKRNFRQLSLEELSRKTGLKPADISSLINHYSAGRSIHSQHDQTEKKHAKMPVWQAILLTLLLFTIIAAVIYSPSINGPFVLDDKWSIPDNSLIHITEISQLRDLIFSPEIDRTIGYMSFALNYYFGGINTFGYHLVNVVIHILNGLLLFFLTYTILTIPSVQGKWRGNALMIALLGSLFWLVHPLQIQAVSYIVQRLTSLSTLFFLLSLLCYIKGRLHTSPQKKVVLFILCIVLGLLALGTKQNTATLPLFIILSEFLFFQHYPMKMDGKKLFFLILIVGVFILIAWTYLGPDIVTKLAQQYEKRGWTPLERVLTQLRVVIFYLSLFLYPHPSRLNLDHDFSHSLSLFSPFTTFVSLLVIISLMILALFLIKRNRLASYAIFWFFGNLVIESSIIPLELVFEHRVYLPSMGLILLATAFGYRVSNSEWQKWVAVLVIPIILLFSYWTFERAHVWGDAIVLWEDAAKKSPNKPRPHNNLCRAYALNGRFDDAVTECRKALSIYPNFAKAHNNLGGAYEKKGMLDEALSEFKQAIALDPDYARAHYNLAVVYAEKEQWDEAILTYTQAIALKPDYADAHNNLAVAYSAIGNHTLAIVHCDKAIALGYKVNPRLKQFLKPFR